MKLYGVSRAADILGSYKVITLQKLSRHLLPTQTCKTLGTFSTKVVFYGNVLPELIFENTSKFCYGI